MRSLKEIMAGLPWARRCVIERRADELAQEAENAELRASLETAVGANAMWKRLYDELRAVIDSRDKAAGFEPLRSETAESKAVCTVAHDDCVLGVGEPNFCPYCEIERLINESEEMCKVRLMLYAERDYARQAARNADAKLAEAERLLDEASPRQECDGCGREFRWHQMFVEEGDRWECAECWDRCEKAERAAMRDRHDDK